MSGLLIKGNKIYTEAGVIRGAVLIKGGRIQSILTDARETEPFNGSVVDAGDNAVLPGLIDLHIHGGGGWQLEATDPAAVRGFTRYLPSLGVTSFLPAVGGGTRDEIIGALRCLSESMKDNSEGAKILGIHLEGPFINKNKKGAFAEERLLAPSVEIMEEFMLASDNAIRYVSLAPELDGAYALIKYLTDRGVVVAGGHTDASYEKTIEAIDNGVRVSTHTGNAQRGIHHRQPGALLAYLLDDRVYCELIADFYHIHKAVVDMVIRLKSTDRVCLISDSVFVSNLQPGKYNFLGNVVTIDEEGWSRLDDGTIAGSTKSLLDGVKNIVQNLSYPLEEVTKMSSLNQARLLGIDNKKGSISVGKDADIIVLDEDFNLLYTFIEGELAFDYNRDKDRQLLNPAAGEFLISAG